MPPIGILPMRQIALYTLLLLLWLAASACKKRVGCTDPASLNYDPDARKSNNSCILVKQERHLPLFQFTAIWNPPCGSYATKAFKQVLADHPGQLIGIASHGSENQPDALTSAYSSQLFEAFGLSEFPYFVLGAEHLGATPYPDSVLPKLLAGPVVANGAASFEIEDDRLHIDAIVRFFMHSEGEFYLSLFVLDGGVDGSDNAPAGFDQMGDNSNTYTHDYILRGGPAPHVMGDLVINGNAQPTSSKRFHYTMDISPDWRKARIEMVGVIWKKEGAAYRYVNAFRAIALDKQ